MTKKIEAIWFKDVTLPDEPEDEFNVVQFFADDSYEFVREGISAKEAVEIAKRYTESVGARIGTTRRVIITDGGDACCFEWKFGEGVTFPPREAT